MVAFHRRRGETLSKHSCFRAWDIGTAGNDVPFREAAAKTHWRKETPIIGLRVGIIRPRRLHVFLTKAAGTEPITDYFQTFLINPTNQTHPNRNPGGLRVHGGDPETLGRIGRISD